MEITITEKMRSSKENTSRKDSWSGMNWITQVKRLSIYLRDGVSCAYCSQSVEDGVRLTLDHILPHSMNGSNHETNLITCCSVCNSSRGNRSVIEFAEGVAHYLNIEAEEIINHIIESKERDLPVKEAMTLIERRGSAAKAIKVARKVRGVSYE